MFYAQCFFVLLSVYIVLCNNDVCDFEDVECTTKIARNAHKLVVVGIPGQIRSSDPLIRDEVYLDYHHNQYKLTNARMSGLKDCIVEEMRLYKLDMAFEYIMLCPKIHMTAEYELNGYILEGKGSCTISVEHYKINLYGKCGGILIDGKLHTQITEFDVEATNKGNIEVDLTNLVDGNKRKSDSIHKDILHSFMKEFVLNTNDYLKLVPTDVMLQRPVNTEL